MTSNDWFIIDGAGRIAPPISILPIHMAFKTQVCSSSGTQKTILDTLQESSVPAPPTHVTSTPVLLADRYRLLRSLGAGGMGNVYLADDQRLSRLVAIKTIRSKWLGNEEVRSRVRRECCLHAAIGTHANIVTLYDTIEQNDRLYMVMEYFAGETLAARLTHVPELLPIGTALDIVAQVLDALACIHGHGIVHRDIKTSNILMQPVEQSLFLVKLTDFGIAWGEYADSGLTRVTCLGMQVPGTPLYMAPERIDPTVYGEIGPPTDLYAVGIILYELLTGKPPFTGTMTEIFSGHLIQTPDLDVLPAQLPSVVQLVLQRALAKDSRDRYADAAAFREALRGIEGEQLSRSSKKHHLCLHQPAMETLVTSAEQRSIDLSVSPEKRSVRFWHSVVVLFVVIGGLVVGYYQNLLSWIVHAFPHRQQYVSQVVEKKGVSLTPQRPLLDSRRLGPQQKRSIGTHKQASVEENENKSAGRSQWRVVQKTTKRIR